MLLQQPVQTTTARHKDLLWTIHQNQVEERRSNFPVERENHRRPRLPCQSIPTCPASCLRALKRMYLLIYELCAPSNVGICETERPNHNALYSGQPHSPPIPATGCTHDRKQRATGVSTPFTVPNWFVLHVSQLVLTCITLTDYTMARTDLVKVQNQVPLISSKPKQRGVWASVQTHHTQTNLPVVRATLLEWRQNHWQFRSNLGRTEVIRKWS